MAIRGAVKVPGQERDLVLCPEQKNRAQVRVQCGEWKRPSRLFRVRAGQRGDGDRPPALGGIREFLRLRRLFAVPSLD
jgi:hypothetical protein